MDKKFDPIGEDDRHDDERRDFLKTAGKFAATVPPAMAFLLTTTLSSRAIAKSSGENQIYEPNRADWST